MKRHAKLGRCSAGDIDTFIYLFIDFRREHSSKQMMLVLSALAAWWCSYTHLNGRDRSLPAAAAANQQQQTTSSATH